MPRTSRSVAQRLATQRSTKKRKPSRSDRSEAPASSSPPNQTDQPMPPTPAGASAVTVDQILDEVVPSAGASRAESMPTLPTAGTRATRRTTSSRLSQRPAPVRRRYAEYAEEYKYIWADLRRIFIVAGVLIALLIVAAFFIE